MEKLGKSFAKLSTKDHGDSRKLSISDLLYPHSVLFVLPRKEKMPFGFREATSPASKSDEPDSKVCRRFETIKGALQFACDQAITGEKQFSIVVQEGEYLDDLVNPKGAELEISDLAIEIRGQGSVRVVYKDENLNLLKKTSLSLCLRDLTIIDRSVNREMTCFMTTGPGDVVELVNVCIIDSRSSPLRSIAGMDGGKLSFTRCFLDNCQMDFVINVEVIFTDCEVQNGFATFRFKSGFKAVGTKFTDFVFKFQQFSTALILRSHFQGNPASADHPNVTLCVHVVDADSGSSVILRDSSVADYYTILLLRQHGTRAIVQNCSISGCRWAFAIAYNVDAKFTDNRFRCPTVLHLRKNVDGKVEFQRNEVLGHSRPKMLIDEVSKAPLHDFPNAVMMPLENCDWQRPKAKEVSKFTGRMKYASDKDRAAARGVRGRGLSYMEKECERCHMNENERLDRQIGRVVDDARQKAGICPEVKPFTNKFKYCCLCKAVCYCSAECQEIDWRDHKLVCAEFAKDCEPVDIDYSRFEPPIVD